MKTPNSEKKENKDGKKQSKSTIVKGGSQTPGFAMAKVLKKTGAGLTISIPCINGDPNRITTSTIRGELKYYNSREIVPSDVEIAVYLADGANVDINFIFPWSTNQADPLRLGGGIIKGTLAEGAQRIMGSTDPLQAPFVKTEWINGTAWVESVFLDVPAGATYYEGDVIFGLGIVDPATGRLAVTPFTLREGDCLDVIA
jgi:hypothetical protein